MTTYPVPKTRCRDRHHPITWAEVRRQYGRMLRRGLTKEEAKAAGPRCQKCNTVFLRDRKAGLAHARTWGLQRPPVHPSGGVAESGVPNGSDN